MLNKIDVECPARNVEEIQTQIADLRRLLAVEIKKTDRRLIETLVGCEAPIRALQVAMVKPFSITFYGDGPNVENMMIVASQVGVNALATKLCDCGHYGNAQGACRCSLAEIRAFQRSRAFKRALESDILVEVVPTTRGRPYHQDLETLIRFNDVHAELFPRVEFRQGPDTAAMRRLFEADCPRASSNHALVEEIARAVQSLDVQRDNHQQRFTAPHHYVEAIQYRYPLEKLT